jgi:hypothetical protein
MNIAKTTLAMALLVTLLSVGVTSAFAQNQTSTQATGLQIQIIPEIQRGWQQHLTIFAVDETGNQVNDTEIEGQVTNTKGKLVGPGEFNTTSGEDLQYKVGPRTNPQNISVLAWIPETNIGAEQNYWVFPKGQAQVPVNDTTEEPIPIPPETTPGNETDPTQGGNDTETPTPTPIPTPDNGTTTEPPIDNGTDTQIPEQQPPTGENQSNANQTGEPLPPVVEPPQGNQSGGNQTQGNTTTTEPPANNGTTEPEPQPQPQPEPQLNATQTFDQLNNLTALVDQKLEEAQGEPNDTQRADLKAAVDELNDGIGQTAGLTVNATEDQLTTLEAAYGVGQEAVNSVFEDENSGSGEEE